MCVIKILFLSFLYMDVQLFWLHLLKRLSRLSFPPLNYLGTFAENKYTTYMWVSLGALTSIPSICVSLCVLLPYWLDYFSFLLTSWNQVMYFLHFFSKFFGCSRSSAFSFRINLSPLQKSLVGLESINNCSESIDKFVGNILTRLSSNP